jgi:flagellar assembly factor FliW
MLLETKHFGPIEIAEEGIINFPDGIPGFEDVNNFILLSTEGEESPFKWLQSTDRPELAFAVVNPFMIKNDYDIDIGEEIDRRLEICDISDVLVLSVIVVPEDISKTSMNLKAPIIINMKKKLGAQVVLDTDRYSVRHYILEELRRQGEAGNACSDKEKEPVHCNRR